MTQQLTVNVNNIVDSVAGDYGKSVSEYQWSLVPSSQIHAAKCALMKSDFVMKQAIANPGSVKEAILKAGVLGIDLTEGKNQGHLLPRYISGGYKIVLQVGYKGVEAIHQRLGVIDRLTIRVVHKEDSFNWSGDDAEKPDHKAEWFSKDRGQIIGAYSITYFPDGTTKTDTAPLTEIYEKHRDISDSWQKYQKELNEGKKPYPPPWVNHEKAMIEKTMAYIASKQWPANIRNDDVSGRIIESLHEVDTQDYTGLKNKYTPEQKDAFDKFIATDNSLGLYLFSKYVDEYAWVGLFNSAPRGEKMRLKDKCREMETQGLQVLDEIKEAISTEDTGRLVENIEDCDKTTIAMLKQTLNDPKVVDDALATLGQ